MQKRILILGANGMTGELLLQQSLACNAIGEIITITRKPLAIRDPKLKNIIHQDFLDFSAVENAFEDIDICYFCLGVYTGAVPNEQFFKITVDYTKSVANLLKQKSPNVVFCFLSGMGADLTEKSKMPFAKAKGIAENYLLNLRLNRLVIFRPGYIYPTVKRKEPNFFYSLFRYLYPLMKLIYPNIGLSSDTLARSMFKAGFEKTPTVILENKVIKVFIAS